MSSWRRLICWIASSSSLCIVTRDFPLAPKLVSHGYFWRRGTNRDSKEADCMMSCFSSPACKDKGLLSEEELVVGGIVPFLHFLKSGGCSGDASGRCLPCFLMRKQRGLGWLVAFRPFLTPPSILGLSYPRSGITSRDAPAAIYWVHCTPQFLEGEQQFIGCSSLLCSNNRQ